MVVHLSRWVVGFAIAVATAGCSSSPKPAPDLPARPTVVLFNLSVASTLNPDLDGRASPVMLKVFELKSTAAFDGADFFSLTDGNKGAAASEIVSSESFVVRPAESRIWRRQLKAETRYIGITAAFRDIERARWRDRLAVEVGRITELDVAVGKLVVSLVNHPEAMKQDDGLTPSRNQSQ